MAAALWALVLVARGMQQCWCHCTAAAARIRSGMESNNKDPTALAHLARAAGLGGPSPGIILLPEGMTRINQPATGARSVRGTQEQLVRPTARWGEPSSGRSGDGGGAVKPQAQRPGPCVVAALRLHTTTEFLARPHASKQGGPLATSSSKKQQQQGCLTVELPIFRVSGARLSRGSACPPAAAATAATGPVCTLSGPDAQHPPPFSASLLSH